VIKNSWPERAQKSKSTLPIKYSFWSRVVLFSSMENEPIKITDTSDVHIVAAQIRGRLGTLRITNEKEARRREKIKLQCRLGDICANLLMELAGPPNQKRENIYYLLGKCEYWKALTHTRCQWAYLNEAKKYLQKDTSSHASQSREIITVIDSLLK